MRIARALALAGVDSRRKSEAHVLAGLVTVNGETVKDLGRQVDPDKDQIAFRGKPLRFERHIYFLLNKPAGYTTTAFDPHAEKTVFRLLPQSLVQSGAHARDERTRVFPVGRLDRESTGLLLFTNDGELANRLTHPRYEVGKWYEVDLNRPLEPGDERRLLQGVKIEDGIARAEQVERLAPDSVKLLIREGRKREVRRIFAEMKYRVKRLCRVAFGPLTLQGLPEGQGRFLTPAEVHLLRRG